MFYFSLAGLLRGISLLSPIALRLAPECFTFRLFLYSVLIHGASLLLIPEDPMIQQQGGGNSDDKSIAEDRT